MATISLCMIVKNEEQHLVRCLDSVAKLVDEIIIVDTGSTDRTVEIALIIQKKSIPIRGQMISPKPETILFPRHLWIIVCGWTLTMFLKKRSWINFCS